ncbi:MAG: hypothetical protein LLH30_15245 [Candidatus Manganitrophus sp. SA1]|nr:hypothetical protein [Candidatus Manganitrophus morganii]
MNEQSAEVHTAWIDAVNAGDLVCLLSLMADDAVFLNPPRSNPQQQATLEPHLTSRLAQRLNPK